MNTAVEISISINCLVSNLSIVFLVILQERRDMRMMNNTTKYNGLAYFKIVSSYYLHLETDGTSNK